MRPGGEVGLGKPVLLAAIVREALRPVSWSFGGLHRPSCVGGWGCSTKFQRSCQPRLLLEYSSAVRAPQDLGC